MLHEINMIKIQQVIFSQERHCFTQSFKKPFAFKQGTRKLVGHYFLQASCARRTTDMRGHPKYIK